MELGKWAAENWFDLVQTLGIIIGFFFTAAALNHDTKARRTSNLIEITNEHREIWSELFRQPALLRVFDMAADLKSKPMRLEEELFIRFLILHLNISYQAMKNGVFITPQGLRKDISQFFSRPMAKLVWEKLRPLQDEDFVNYVEACMDEQPAYASEASGSTI